MSEVYMKFIISLCYSLSLSHLQKGTSDTDQRENILFSETYDIANIFI